jgi:hypothetical protein
MKRKEINILCLISCILVFLSGCESAPTLSENAKERDTLTKSEKYVSIDEAKKEIATVAGKKIDGFEFPQYTNINDIENIYEMKLGTYCTDDINDVKNTACALWSGYNDIDWTKVETREYPNPSFPNYQAYAQIDNQNNYAYSYDNYGFFMGSSLEEDSPDMRYAKTAYDIQTMEHPEEIYDDEYKLKDGSITVKKAIDFVESEINKKNKLEKNITYKVQKIFIIKSNDGYDQISMIVGKVIDNVDIVTQSDFYFTSSNRYNKKAHIGEFILVVMTNNNEISYVNTGVPSLNITKSEKRDKIISPYWAISEMNEKIAHIGGMTFSVCDLVYIVTQDNKEKEQGHVELHVPDESLCIRPYWLFAYYERDSSYINVFGESILVDALDGEVYYYEATSSY